MHIGINNNNNTKNNIKNKYSDYNNNSDSNVQPPCKHARTFEPTSQHQRKVATAKLKVSSPTATCWVKSTLVFI